MSMSKCATFPVASASSIGVKIGVHVNTFHRDLSRFMIKSAYGVTAGSTLM